MDTIIDKVLLPFLILVGPPVAAFLAAQLTLLAKRVAAKAKIDLDDVQEENLRRKIRGHILHTQQTFVKQARLERAKDGHLSLEDAGKAALLTLKMSTRDLGVKGLKTLANVTGKGSNAIAEVIEEEVAALKLIPKVSGTPPA